MAKKTLILTQKQLDEIIGGELNSDYFDNSPVPNFSTEIHSDGYGQETKTTSQVYANQLPRGEFRMLGATRINESGEDNQRLSKMKFGASNNDGNNDGKSLSATKTTLSRANKAIETMKTGATQTEKNAAKQTLKRMQSNTDLNTLKNQYTAAKNNDKSIRQNKVRNGQQVIKSAPKTGQGTAHSPKNGIITYK